MNEKDIKTTINGGHMERDNLIADTLKSLREDFGEARKDISEMNRKLSDFKTDYAKEVTEVKSKVCNVQEKLEDHIQSDNQEINKKNYNGGIMTQVVAQFVCTILTVLVTLYIASSMK